MKAVILAAGMAKRLRPLTDTKPKCLLKIGNKCLLERTFDALIENDINEFVVVTGYRGNMIRDFINNHYNNKTIHFIDNKIYAETNNIYSLWMTRDFVAGQEFMLLDSDIIFDPLIIKRLLMSGKQTVLSMNSHPLGEEEMKVIIGDDGLVKELSKNCNINESSGESIGIELFSADYSEALFKELNTMILKENLVDIFYERAFERLIPQGHYFQVENVSDLFSAELDTVDDFLQAQKLIPKELY